MSGSSLFKSRHAARAHILTGHGVSAEVTDLRADLLAEFAPMAAITVEEYTDSPASGAALLLAATASTVAVQTYLAAALLAGGLATMLAHPRNVTFTTAGATASDAPATALITGTDRNGKAQTETVNIAQTATIAKGVKLFKTITSIVYAAGDGTGATVSIGLGDLLPLSKTPKSRAGLVAIVREIAVGALVTTGVLDAVNLTYLPAAGCNGTNDFAIYYEYDPSQP
jgi:hypothetical protein